jgi:hypothetical protein
MRLAVSQIIYLLFYQADEPDVQIKGNAIGREDYPMSVPIEVRVEDRDSETFELIIRGTSVPANSTIYGASGLVIEANGDGDYVLNEDDTAVFMFKAPLHYSDVRWPLSSGVHCIFRPYSLTVFISLKIFETSTRDPST